MGVGKTRTHASTRYGVLQPPWKNVILKSVRVYFLTTGFNGYNWAIKNESVTPAKRTSLKIYKNRKSVCISPFVYKISKNAMHLAE